ncbi:MAG: hypothetical protein J7K36_10800 [Archaeoglobaceae archaeon]|nr:hypothetical protein [Archaeoglobaceae archaeon]
MMESIFFGLLLILSILISGFFVWISLKIIGKKKGILEASLANLGAVVFASIVTIAIALIPLIGYISPIGGYFAYLYALKVLLNISMFDSFLVSIVSVVVFVLLSTLISFVFGIWLLKYALFKPMFRPFFVHF